MNPTSPLLFFSMQLDSTPLLNIGRLFLLDINTGFLGRWLATSGIGDWQDAGDWSKQGGGVIPPNYKVNDVPYYLVHSQPVYQDLGGIFSNTYYIDPETITTSDGVKRSELLIHKSRFSAPMSGSLGCIVLPEKEFEDFERVFKKECSAIAKVPLLVGYTFD